MTRSADIRENRVDWNCGSAVGERGRQFQADGMDVRVGVAMHHLPVGAAEGPRRTDPPARRRPCPRTTKARVYRGFAVTWAFA